MDKTEIIKGLKIATNKIGGCSDVGGWLSDDESKAVSACEQVIKGFEYGTIILREEDKCTSVEELEKIKAEIEEKQSKYMSVTDYSYGCYKAYEETIELIDNHITEMKGENK